MTVDERTSVLHAAPSATRLAADLVDELPTTALAVVGAPPVFVDDSGRRRRTLAGVGSAVAALCVLYLCVVVLGVLRGADNPLLGPVGGLLPAVAGPEVVTPAAPPVAREAGAPAAGTGPARTAGSGVPAALVPAPAPPGGPVVVGVAPSTPSGGMRSPATGQPAVEPERGDGDTGAEPDPPGGDPVAGTTPEAGAGPAAGEGTPEGPPTEPATEEPVVGPGTDEPVLPVEPVDPIP